MAESPGERRRYERCPIVAMVQLFRTDEHANVGRFMVQDVSAGGARLLGAPGIELGRGEPLRAVLELPHREPLTLAARVARVSGPDRGAASFAISFLDVSPEDEDSIHQGLMAELERQRAQESATIIVVADGDGVREQLLSELRDMGREAVAVATPLEAMGWLTAPRILFDTALIAMGGGTGPSVDVLDFLNSELPHVRRVAVVERGAEFRGELAIRSGRAHAALNAPWNRAELIGALRGRAPVSPA